MNIKEIEHVTNEWVITLDRGEACMLNAILKLYIDFHRGHGDECDCEKLVAFANILRDCL